MNNADRMLCAVCATMPTDPVANRWGYLQVERVVDGVTERLPCPDAERLRAALLDGYVMVMPSSGRRLTGFAVTTVNGTALCGEHTGDKSFRRAIGA